MTATYYIILSDREWIERTIARNDKDGDGGINLEEFVEMNIRSRFSRGRSPSSSGSGTSTAAASSDLHEKARLAFNAYDRSGAHPTYSLQELTNNFHISSRNRDGYLTKAELRKTSRKMTDAQIDAVFEKFDRNKDGRLDFEEFKELMESHKKSPPK